MAAIAERGSQSDDSKTGWLCWLVWFIGSLSRAKMLDAAQQSAASLSARTMHWISASCT